MATYEEKKQAFIEMFANDPDIKIIPLPDSVREKLGVYQDISYMSIGAAVNKCLFSGNRYSSYEERKPQESVEFPDLAKLAEEAKAKQEEENKEKNE